MKIEITIPQLYDIAQMANDMQAMLGNGEPEADKPWRKYIRSVDRMLKKNGLRRDLSGVVRIN